MAFIVIHADVGMIIGMPPSPLRLVAANTAVATPYTTLVEGVEKMGHGDVVGDVSTTLMIVLIAVGVQ